LLGLCQKSVLHDGEIVGKKKIRQLSNLTGIGIEQRGLFTKHPIVCSEEEKKSWAVQSVPACLLLIVFYGFRLLNEVTQDLNIWMSCYEDVVNLIIGLDELFSGEMFKSRFPSLLL
jgi:hypothetical protein